MADAGPSEVAGMAPPRAVPGPDINLLACVAVVSQDGGLLGLAQGSWLDIPLVSDCSRIRRKGCMR